MRKINYNDHVNGKWQTGFPNEGTFHGFFTDSDSESNAIVERADGTIDLIYSRNIKFIETPINNSNGLTKREQFAMAAMQGIMANPNSWKADDETLVLTCLDMADMLLLKLEESTK